MKFETPQINLYVEDVDVSKAFYEKLGFKLKFTAEMDGTPVHYEFLMDGFTLGVASKKAARNVHGMSPGKNAGCGIVLWTDNTDSAIQFLLENGASLISEPVS